MPFLELNVDETYLTRKIPMQQFLISYCPWKETTDLTADLTRGNKSRLLTKLLRCKYRDKLAILGVSFICSCRSCVPDRLYTVATFTQTHVHIQTTPHVPATPLISNETWVCHSEHVVRSSTLVRERAFGNDRETRLSISGTVVVRAFGCSMSGD